MAETVYKEITDLDSATLPLGGTEYAIVSQTGKASRALWSGIFGGGWWTALKAALSSFKAPDADHADDADTVEGDSAADLHDAAQLTGTVALVAIPDQLTGKYAAIPRMIVLDSGSGVWTVPAGVTRLRITLIGGGGAGNTHGSNSSDDQYGGGGAANVISVLSVTPGAEYSYTIGSGGATVGATGGTTIFAGEAHSLSAGGGLGASTTGVGAGGGASGGMLNINGQSGFCGSASPAYSNYGRGLGGSSLYGFGGIPSTGYGAGGKGTISPYVAGTDGCIILEY
jgi:hypothetical protein